MRNKNGMMAEKIKNPQNIKTSDFENNWHGLYLHIPFCKQACHYCDFHFSTTMKYKSELVDALCQELILRKEEVSGIVKTIYFGGGTPSLLTFAELNQIFQCIYENYSVAESAEITLEANPDDLSEEKINELSKTKINRLSIGVQSFFEEDLKLMNRAHNAEEAIKSIELAKKFFDNISIDLIYGIPGMSNARWKKNLEIALETNVPHISAYALTVEPKTALAKFIKTGKIKSVDDEVAQQHFEILTETLDKAGMDHYEFSNFGKPGFFSQNNLAYWHGKKYLGIGPAAHSYNGKLRSWNIANNNKYIKSIQQNELPHETEILSKTDRYNEFVMTHLRLREGISVNDIEDKFGIEKKVYLLEQAQTYLKQDLLLLESGFLKITKKGKFLSDGIAAGLFYIEE
ncbi:MAG TPA: radical SAM family heme chaperone HemW [Flavobacteriaceae bacterium]|nr:radical SAM family heme chaperone HemW [Flavobacteriaceae bacterium]